MSCGTVALGVVGVGMAIAAHQELSQLAISVSAVADSIERAEAQAMGGLIAAAIRDHKSIREQ